MWSSDALNVITWQTSPNEGIDFFDLELTRLNTDGILFVAKNGEKPTSITPLSQSLNYMNSSYQPTRDQHPAHGHLAWFRLLLPVLELYRRSKLCRFQPVHNRHLEFLYHHRRWKPDRWLTNRDRERHAQPARGIPDHPGCRSQWRCIPFDTQVHSCCRINRVMFYVLLSMMRSLLASDTSFSALV